MVAVAYVALALMIVVESDRPYRDRVERLHAELAYHTKGEHIGRRADDAAFHARHARSAVLRLRYMTQARWSARLAPILSVTLAPLVVLLAAAIARVRHPARTKQSIEPGASFQNDNRDP
jgi:hypothetical protein